MNYAWFAVFTFQLIPQESAAFTFCHSSWEGWSCFYVLPFFLYSLNSIKRFLPGSGTVADKSTQVMKNGGEWKLLTHAGYCSNCKSCFYKRRVCQRYCHNIWYNMFGIYFVFGAEFSLLLLIAHGAEFSGTHFRYKVVLVN